MNTDDDRRDDSKTVKVLDGAAEVAWWYVCFDAIGNIFASVFSVLGAIFSSEG